MIMAAGAQITARDTADASPPQEHGNQGTANISYQAVEVLVAFPTTHMTMSKEWHLALNIITSIKI